MFAIANGQIEFARLVGSSGFIVLIRHDAPAGLQFKLTDGNGAHTVWSLYVHLASLDPNPRTGEAWQSGDQINRGEMIGPVGDFPHASGSGFHLHFEIREESKPATFLPCGMTGEEAEEIYEDPSAFLQLNRTVTFAPLEFPIDVYLLVDLTGSFLDDLPRFKEEAPKLITNLKAAHSDIRFGLGKFQDYPINPFGSAELGDVAYERLLNLGSDTDLLLETIRNLATEEEKGLDEPESQLVALYQAATGEGQELSAEGYPEASIPPNQQASFRADAVKVIVLWTDAPFHLPGDSGDIPYPGPSFTKTVEALLKGGIVAIPGSSSVGQVSAAAASSPIKVIGMTLGSGAIDDLRRISTETGAIAPPEGVDCDGDGTTDISAGEPLVCRLAPEGGGISGAITAAVSAVPQFEYSDLEVGQTVVLLGEELVASVRVRNPGASRRSEIIQLKLDGSTEENREVTLGPGESRRITLAKLFTERRQLGEHTITIGILSPVSILVTTIKDVIAARFDNCPPEADNPDRVICYKEISFASWLYLTQEPIPGLEGRKLSREKLEELIAYYLTATSVEESLPKASPQAVKAQLEALLGRQESEVFSVDKVRVVPNPIRSTDTAEFQVLGTGISSVEVQVFDLSGREVLDSGPVMGSSLEWHLEDQAGDMVANGVYLYFVTIKGVNGKVITSAVKKLIVLR